MTCLYVYCYVVRVIEIAVDKLNNSLLNNSNYTTNYYSDYVQNNSVVHFADSSLHSVDLWFD